MFAAARRPTRTSWIFRRPSALAWRLWMAAVRPTASKASLLNPKLKRYSFHLHTSDRTAYTESWRVSPFRWLMDKRSLSLICRRTTTPWKNNTRVLRGIIVIVDLCESAGVAWDEAGPFQRSHRSVKWLLTDFCLFLQRHTHVCFCLLPNRFYALHYSFVFRVLNRLCFAIQDMPTHTNLRLELSKIMTLTAIKQGMIISVLDYQTHVKASKKTKVWVVCFNVNIYWKGSVNNFNVLHDLNSISLKLMFV